MPEYYQWPEATLLNEYIDKRLMPSSAKPGAITYLELHLFGIADQPHRWQAIDKWYQTLPRNPEFPFQLKNIEATGAFLYDPSNLNHHKYLKDARMHMEIRWAKVLYKNNLLIEDPINTKSIGSWEITSCIIPEEALDLTNKDVIASTLLPSTKGFLGSPFRITNPEGKVSHFLFSPLETRVLTIAMSNEGYVNLDLLREYTLHEGKLRDKDTQLGKTLLSNTIHNINRLFHVGKLTRKTENFLVTRPGKTGFTIGDNDNFRSRYLIQKANSIIKTSTNGHIVHGFLPQGVRYDLLTAESIDSVQNLVKFSFRNRENILEEVAVEVGEYMRILIDAFAEANTNTLSSFEIKKYFDAHGIDMHSPALKRTYTTFLRALNDAGVELSEPGYIEHTQSDGILFVLPKFPTFEKKLPIVRPRSFQGSY